MVPVVDVGAMCVRSLTAEGSASMGTSHDRGLADRADDNRGVQPRRTGPDRGRLENQHTEHERGVPDGLDVRHNLVCVQADDQNTDEHDLDLPRVPGGA